MIGNFRVPITAGGSSLANNLSNAIPAYTRPTDWLTLPTISVGEQKVVLLHSVFNNDSNFCALQCASNYTVDWGDGTTNNYSANVSAYHVYDYNYAGFVGTESTKGYRQAIVTITPQATFNLTKVDLNIKHTQSGLGSYSANWLEISMVGQYISSLVVSGNNAPARQLEIFDFIGTNALTSLSSCFYNAFLLKWVKNLYTTDVLSMNSTFKACYSLPTVPLFDTAKVTDMSSMFIDCLMLITVPFFNTSLVTSFGYMFMNCGSLVEVPFFNTQSASNFQYMFTNCSSLGVVPFFNLNNASTTFFMFAGCSSLVEVPLFNLVNVIDATNMFAGCSALQTIPLFNTVNFTTMANLFNGCVSLQTVPLLNTGNVTSMANMFQNCKLLQSVPLLNTVKVTNMSNMFYGCSALQSVPLFDTAKVTNMSNMFYNCSQLRSIPLFNTSLVTVMNAMFSFCHSLLFLPNLDTSKVTTMDSMFQYCYALQTAPNFIFTIGTNTGYMFYSCIGLVSVPALNGNYMTTFNVTFAGCSTLSRVQITNIGVSVSFSGCRLSKIALLEIFGNLKKAVAQTITITGNWGADTAVSKTSCGTTAGSAVVTQSNTASLAVGMLVLGTGISTSQAVSFQDSGDTVTLNAHGLVDGNVVSFPTIVTTTGIAINTPYFVVNATTNTFQLSLTLGGSAIVLTTNGTGTVAYGSYIQSIITNTSFTLDKPASATGTVTLTSRILDTSIATLKGWTVTG